MMVLKLFSYPNVLNIKIIFFQFIHSRLLKENYFDAFTIDLNYINGKFNFLSL